MRRTPVPRPRAAPHRGRGGRGRDPPCGHRATSPVDHLTIDRSFVAGIGADDRRTELVRAFMALAHALGLSPIEEGIETVEQLEFLRSVGCRHGQGYLLARPLRSAHLEQLCAIGALTVEPVNATSF